MKSPVLNHSVPVNALRNSGIAGFPILKKLNLAAKKVLLYYIYSMIRFLYQNLLNWKNSNKRKPLIIRGARQVGKTWLVKEFGRKEYAQIHAVNFEKDAAACSLFQIDLSPKKLLHQLGLYLDRTIDIHSDLLFFDEVQECPRAITSLKYYAEELPELSVCCAGFY